MPAIIPNVYSTLFLTILLFYGLFSFLRGSIRDRTVDALFMIDSATTDDHLLKQVRNHFNQRTFKVVDIDPQRDVANLVGQVKPSLFLAIFLSALAAIGMICLGLVVGILIPDLGNLWLWLTVISPIAGIFYWRGTPRERRVSLQLLPDAKLKVRAHKDEIEELQRSLKLEKID